MRRNGGRLITACGDAGGLACGVDASHLHRHCGEPRHAHDEHDNQCSDRECGFDCDATGLIGYTLVFNARLMMFVSALTIESPVITV